MRTEEFCREMRRIILQQSMRARVGHIGSALSIADIVGVLYCDVMRLTSANDPDRDRLVLSKGHAALAVYAALHLRKFLSVEQLNTFCCDDSVLGVHPEHALGGIDFSTGSLGQGLSMAAGSALAAKIQGSDRQVYAVLSDGECNEGAVWEAIAFAAQHKLSNLCVIVDVNGQQAFGYTRDVIEMDNMGERWSSFRWNVHDVDGHDAGALSRLLKGLQENPGSGPNVVMARTTFGKGVGFMEGQIKWHYWPMNQQEFDQAMAEVESPA
jgi:transketolase